MAAFPDRMPVYAHEGDGADHRVVA